MGRYYERKVWTIQYIILVSPSDSLMIRNFVGGGFKIQCFYCKTFNIIYPQDPDYMHPMLQPSLRQDSALAMFKCIACRQWTKYYWDKRHDLKNANSTAFSRANDC